MISNTDAPRPVLGDVLLVDDLRVFRQEVSGSVARTSAQGRDLLRYAVAAGHRWEQVWLDHDLGDLTGVEDMIGPVVDWLCEQASAGRPAPVGVVVVHTTNAPAGASMVRVLRAAGYQVVRVVAREHLDVDPVLYEAATGHRPRG
ncbi:cyclic-phosphate processing receiver domain-containing protein [Oerskovia sp. NPDC057915]|uniref:cyclic-phosphate processing receiver domain-containing protein n=1 Tax=Oerskovia sp. NPDC057915 TaxID=3346280 RepID=UPI0036DE2941